MTIECTLALTTYFSITFFYLELIGFLCVGISITIRIYQFVFIIELVHIYI